MAWRHSTVPGPEYVRPPENAVAATSVGATYELTPEGSAAIEAFARSVPLTREAVSAGGAALERQFDADPDRYLRAVPSLTDREVRHSFSEPLDTVPDEIADQRADAVRRVLAANRLLAGARDVLGAEAVELLLENLAAPALEAA